MPNTASIKGKAARSVITRLERQVKQLRAQNTSLKTRTTKKKAEGKTPSPPASHKLDELRADRAKLRRDNTTLQQEVAAMKKAGKKLIAKLKTKRDAPARERLALKAAEDLADEILQKATRDYNELVNHLHPPCSICFEDDEECFVTCCDGELCGLCASSMLEEGRCWYCRSRQFKVHAW